MTEPAQPRSRVPNILAILGLIILFIIIVWGLIHLASLGGGSFSGLFQKKNDTKITVTAPATVQSGTPMTISWKFTTKDKGSYAFLYQCGTGAQIATPRSDQVFVPVPCGAAFTLGNASTSATLLPLSNATSSIKIPLTVIFIPNATGTQAQGSASVTITQRTAPATSTPTTTPVTEKPTPVTPTPIAKGPADLVVTVISSSIDGYGNGTVVFDIANMGDSHSGSYTFQAQLPTSQPYTYSSPAQSSLAPGSHVQNTLNFTQGMSGTFLVTVTGQGGNESNLGNNSASQYLSGPAYQNQYQYPQYQYQYGY
ncbi:MAG: hypothetical protein WC050_00295 [Candidatus Paceibacterota bacterium]